MMCYKKKFTYLLTISALISTMYAHTWWGQNNQNDQRIKNYIEHLADTLFNTPNQDPLGCQDIKELISEAQYTILNSSHTIIYSTSFDTERVQEMVLSEALTFIRNRSHAYALEITHKFDSPYSQFDAKKIANEVADQIHDQAQQKVTHAVDRGADLAGILHPYVGSCLKTLIHPLVQQLVRKYSRISSNKPCHKPPVIYNADVRECEICAEDFDNRNHKRIVLSCGHLLCKKCTLDIAKKTTACPMCRRPTLVISELSDQL